MFVMLLRVECYLGFGQGFSACGQLEFIVRACQATWGASELAGSHIADG
jgi:hypothetical protein